MTRQETHGEYKYSPRNTVECDRSPDDWHCRHEVDHKRDKIVVTEWCCWCGETLDYD